jgi:hypothetical protein
MSALLDILGSFGISTADLDKARGKVNPPVPVDEKGDMVPPSVAAAAAHGDQAAEAAHLPGHSESKPDHGEPPIDTSTPVREPSPSYGGDRQMGPPDVHGAVRMAPQRQAPSVQSAAPPVAFTDKAPGQTYRDQAPGRAGEVGPVVARDTDPEYREALAESARRHAEVQGIHRPMELAEAYFQKRAPNFSGFDEYVKEPLEAFKAHQAGIHSAEENARSQQEQLKTQNDARAALDKADQEHTAGYNRAVSAKKTGLLKPDDPTTYLDKDAEAELQRGAEDFQKGQEREFQTKQGALNRSASLEAAAIAANEGAAARKYNDEQKRKEHEDDAADKEVTTYAKTASQNDPALHSIDKVGEVLDNPDKPLPGYEGARGSLRSAGNVPVIGKAAVGVSNISESPEAADFKQHVRNLVRTRLAGAQNRPVSDSEVEKYIETAHLGGNVPEGQARANLKTLHDDAVAKIRGQDAGLSSNARRRMEEEHKPAQSDQLARRRFHFSLHGEPIMDPNDKTKPLEYHADPEEDVLSAAQQRFGPDVKPVYRGQIHGTSQRVSANPGSED